MTKIVKLHPVAPATADDEAKAEAIRLIEELLEEAKRGEITEFAIVILRPGDGEVWDERATSTRKKSAWVGKLMTLMVNWIVQGDDREKDECNV